MHSEHCTMGLDFQNYLYSSSPPDFELFTPLYLGKRRRTPPKIAVRKLPWCREEDESFSTSFQQLQLGNSSLSDDSLREEEYGVDVVGLTKCKDRSVVHV